MEWVQTLCETDIDIVTQLVDLSSAFDRIARALAIIKLLKFKDIYERWEELSKQQRHSIAQLNAVDEGYEVRLKWDSWANSISGTSRLSGKLVVE